MAQPQVFEEATIAITETRLLIAALAPPLGFELREAHTLAACSILNGKERPDGTRLLVLRHDAGTLCLAFGAQRSREADALVSAIGIGAATPPPVAPPPVVPPTAEAAPPLISGDAPAAPPPVPAPNDYGDTFALTQFLHDLTEANINGESDEE